MRRKSLLILMTALFTTVAQNDVLAQASKYRDKANDPVVKLGYEKKLRWADGLFKSGSYFNAVDYYNQLLEEQPRNPYLHYQIAECYAFLRDYPLAAKHFGTTYDLSKQLYPEAVYRQGQMLKMSGEYDKAIAAFKKFIEDNPKTYKKEKKRAQVEIDGCEMGKKSTLDPIDAKIFNLGPNVNTAYTELSPLALGDTALLFATMKNNQVVDANKEKREDYVSRFMVSHKFKNKEEKDTFQWSLNIMLGMDLIALVVIDSSSHVV
jgi:tetratricopeptide (TPR) repeat protein